MHVWIQVKEVKKHHGIQVPGWATVTTVYSVCDAIDVWVAEAQRICAKLTSGTSHIMKKLNSLH